MAAPRIVLPWERLHPIADMHVNTLGATSIVVKASLRNKSGGRTPVAIKLFKKAYAVHFNEKVPPGDKSVMDMLLEEAQMMSDASNNVFVVKYEGVVAGPLTDEWMQALGPSAMEHTFRECTFQPALPAASPPEMIGLVLEWAEHGSLADKLYVPGKLRGWSLGEVLQLCADIATGVRMLHVLDDPGLEYRGIAHGDIKATNILLKKKWSEQLQRVVWRPLLTDFGLSKSIKLATTIARQTAPSVGGGAGVGGAVRDPARFPISSVAEEHVRPGGTG